MNITEETMRPCLCKCATGKAFLSMTPIPEAIKEKINKFDCIKSKHLCGKNHMSKVKKTN